MLDTLIKIGKWQSEKMRPIERFLTKPKLKEGKTYYVANLIFDLDEHNIYFEKLKKYDEEKDIKQLLLLKILPGNNKSIYATVEKSKIESLIKSFFGKIDEKELKNVEHGELYLKIKDLNVENDFLKILDEIVKLKNVLIKKITKEEQGDKLDAKILIKEIELGRDEDIAIITASVKSEKFGIKQPVLIAKTDDYIEFVNSNFLTDKNNKKESKRKLCYATGEASSDVKIMELDERKSLNKMFGAKTYINYASEFSINNYYKNYQVSSYIQTLLDNGSKFIVNNYSAWIAGVKHLIIPTFLVRTNLDLDFVFEKIINTSDFIFNKVINQIDTDIVDEINKEHYWINYLAYETDGKSFKTTSQIKDISTPWFVKIIKTLKRVNDDISYGYNSNAFYNFYTFYRYIPVKTRVNKNEALELFRDIFEHRVIDKQILFRHFTKYLIVQRSGQFDKGKHRGYANISEQSNFDYATSNASGNDYKNRIENFFAEMDYTDRQKGLFYLGRVLNSVAYAQEKSNHPTKPVMNKLNYNGMDKNAVMRLYLDLQEKVRQYITKINLTSVEFDFAAFIQHFNPNEKDSILTPEENVFYILSGYSFGLIGTGNNYNGSSGNDSDEIN